jgi:hypothetical protein
VNVRPLSVLLLLCGGALGGRGVAGGGAPRGIRRRAADALDLGDRRLLCLPVEADAGAFVRRGTARPQHDQADEHGHAEGDKDGRDDLAQMLGYGGGRTVTVAVPVTAARTGAVPAVSAAVPVTRAVPTAVAVARPVLVTRTGAVSVAGAPATTRVSTSVTAASVTAASVATTGAVPSVAGPMSGSAAGVRARTLTAVGPETVTVLGTESGPGTGSVSGAGNGSATGAVPLSLPGASAGRNTRPAGLFGRWERGMGCRGHRPIIARTRGALCSPRQNCR